MNVSEFIVKELIKYGINTSFSVTGGGSMFLNDAIGKNSKFNKIYMKHANTLKQHHNKVMSKSSFHHCLPSLTKLFTRRQLDLVDKARKLYALVGRPNYQCFLSMIRESRLRNCPVAIEDALRATDIYGQDIAALRGKTVRHQPVHVLAPSISPVPPLILQHHNKVQLCVDICFINNIAFLVSISRVIKLRTVDQVADVSDKTIIPSLKSVIHIYYNDL